MQYKSHNYNNFIISLTKYFYLKDFIFTLDSLIKYLMNIKDNKAFIKIKYVYMNKVNVTCNQPISYMIISTLITQT